MEANYRQRASNGNSPDGPTLHNEEVIKMTYDPTADEVALYISVYEGMEDHVRELLALGVDPNIRDPYSDDDYFTTLLGQAIQEGHLGVVELLLDHGADPNAPARVSLPGASESPCYHAWLWVRDKKVARDIIELLMQRGGRLTPGERATLAQGKGYAHQLLALEAMYP